MQNLEELSKDDNIVIVNNFSQSISSSSLQTATLKTKIKNVDELMREDEINTFLIALNRIKKATCDCYSLARWHYCECLPLLSCTDSLNNDCKNKVNSLEVLFFNLN